MVGDLPEIVEPDAGAVPQPLTLPVTINGRIFPREDVDEWSVHLNKGASITAEALAAKLGSPLEVRLEAREASAVLTKLASNPSVVHPPKGLEQGALIFLANDAEIISGL